MTFTEWRYWFKSLHWSFRWFVLLVLVRPVIDNFYQLKEVSPLLSPIYIVGVLTPLLIIISFLSKQFPKRTKSVADVWIAIWGFLIFVNCIIILFYNSSFEILGNAIKYISPVLLYFFIRHLVRSREDMIGMLQTFLYSAIVPAGLMVYEYVFSPIAIEYLSEGRGGGTRISGGYADIMNYAIYIIGIFLIAGYYYLSKIYVRSYLKDSFTILIFFLGCITGLSAIKQVSSWGVFVALFIILFLFMPKNAQGFMFFILFILILIPFFAQDIYHYQIQPLIEKEIRVAEGETEIGGLGNGRLNRWIHYFEVWERMPSLSYAMGVSASGFKEVPIMIGGGMHNDYIRNLFLTGIVGLLAYLLFLLTILRRAFTMAAQPDKFLVLGAVLSILLYSASTLPTLYAPYLYLVFSIFAYALLPKHLQ